MSQPPDATPATDPAPALAVADGEGRWVVLKTRPRCEKRVEHHCRTLGLTVYLPLRAKTHHYGARVRAFSSPLFPGYLFCVMSPDQRIAILESKRVARILEAADQGELVRQLNHIATALKSEEFVDVMPFLEQGRRVVVTSGRLKGVEGIVQHLKGKTRVVINIEMIQQAVAVEVNASDLGAV